MPLQKSTCGLVQQLFLVYWVSQLEVRADRQSVQKQKEMEKLVDWDYAGLHLINSIPLQDKLNYHKLCFMRRERQQYENKLSALRKQEKKLGRKRRAVYRAPKPTYPTPKVVDYLNERAVREHNHAMAEESRKRFHWESKENEIPKPRAYYTSNESKKKPLYQFNERALREKEVAKRIDYENYAADEDYRNKPRAYYFKDEAKYVNVPKAKAAKMAEELRRGPKYKFRMIGRHPRHVTSATEKEKAKSPYTGTTWAFVHYKKFSGPWRVNLSAEIIEQVIEGKEKMVAKQAALEETGAYPLKHKLENRTTFVLPTWRNFIHDVKDFRPYTFKDDPIDKQLDHIDSIYIPSEEVTVPANWNDWIMPQLIEYRKKYRGLTVQEPFAHYPQYSWENIGFDINKLEDPLPPIWPLEKAQFNADVMREHMGVTAEPPVAHDDAEWDSQGREKRTIFVPPTRRVIIPGHPDYFI